MATKQTIAIIGATGNMGSAIARSLSKGPYRLLLMARETEKLHKLQNDITQTVAGSEVEVIGCPKDASWEADIIILAVPYTAEADIAPKIRPFATRKIVISIANPLNDTFTGLITAPDTSAAEELQKLLPNSTVVKAFNTTFAADFANPVIDGKTVDAFIAGDDHDALEEVTKLVSAVGFNPIIAGELSVSRTLENMQLLLIRLGIRYQYNWLAGWKILHN